MALEAPPETPSETPPFARLKNPAPKPPGLESQLSTGLAHGRTAPLAWALQAARRNASYSSLEGAAAAIPESPHEEAAEEGEDLESLVGSFSGVSMAPRYPVTAPVMHSTVLGAGSAFASTSTLVPTPPASALPSGSGSGSGSAVASASILRRRGQPDGDEDLPTPAIEIPHAHGRGMMDSEDTFDGSLAEPEYFDESALGRYMAASKRSSISFDPEVSVDDGAAYSLDEPRPRQGDRTRPRGRSMLEELQKRDVERQLSRARSETDREDYDRDTGERLSERQRGQRDQRYVVHQPRWPFLQTTVDSLAEGNVPVHAPSSRRSEPAASTASGAVLRPVTGPRLVTRDASASLTSRTTATSPDGGALATPASDTSGADADGPAVVSPLAVSSPDHPSAGPEWFGALSVENAPRRLATRSKSYSNERRLQRRASRRSSNGNPHSPASAFLSRYFSHSPSAPSSAAPDDEGQEVGEYVLGHEIGFGGFSVIREASTIEGGQRVTRAVKIVRRQVPDRSEPENDALQAEYEHEVEIWRALSHPHILPLYAVYVTEFATFAITHLNTGGTLFDAVRAARTGLPPPRARRYAYQVASALRYLHEDMRIVHRDVKLENCLIDVSDPAAAEQGGKILLCDFGLADYMVDDERANDTPRGLYAGARNGSHANAHAHSHHTHNPSADHLIGPSGTSTNFTGSLPYASPEMLDAGRVVLSPPSDMWAFGVVCFALITGRLPFSHAFAPRVRMMILNGEYDRALVKAREAGSREGGRGGEAVQPEIKVAAGVDAVNWAGGAGTAPPHAAVTNGASRAADRADRAEPPLELQGAAQLVAACLLRHPKRRWTIRDCFSSRWLEPELDGSGRRPGWAA